MRQIVFRSVLPLLLGAAAFAGCGDALSLLPPRFENQVDTTALWAATGTPVVRPSAFVISQGQRVRLDQVTNFDFYYDIDPAGERFFIPLAAVVNTGRTVGNPGFREELQIPFDSIKLAPQENYISQDTVRFRVGDVFYVRSAVESSCLLGIPYYAKLQILSVDDSARAVSFQILINANCGYRSLETGLPKK
ncbi:MAG TPA: hypothetical protein VGQ69_16480 [Gemmatimonadales bacterium]|jgi:hypothetical protein|nr:hypothetical protein [Gemmatimonadales bacterium]